MGKKLGCQIKPGELQPATSRWNFILCVLEMEEAKVEREREKEEKASVIDETKWPTISSVLASNFTNRCAYSVKLAC